MSDQRFRISTHDNGYYCVSIPMYEGGEVIRAEEYDRLRGMLISVLDANYGTAVHDIGSGDGLIAAEIAPIQRFWREHLNETRLKEPSK